MKGLFFYEENKKFKNLNKSLSSRSPSQKPYFVLFNYFKICNSYSFIKSQVQKIKNSLLSPTNKSRPKACVMFIIALLEMIL
jgi:hypothetical protein